MSTPPVPSPPTRSIDPHTKRKCPSRKLRDQRGSCQFILAKNSAENNLTRDQNDILLKENKIHKEENIKLKEDIVSLENDNRNKKYEIELLKKEILKLMEEIKEVAHNSTIQLKTQKSTLDIKHKAILKQYTDNLKASYDDTFKKSIKSYKDEIELLKNEIQIEISSRLALNTRRPIFSPGRYKPD